MPNCSSAIGVAGAGAGAVAVAVAAAVTVAIAIAVAAAARALKQLVINCLAQLTGTFFEPVSCANTLIIGNISATATDVRTSKLHWKAVFLYVHQEKCLSLAVCTDVRTSANWGVAKELTLRVT